MNILLICDSDRVKRIFETFEKQESLQLRTAAALNQADQEIEASAPEFVFVQSRISGFSGEIILRHLKKILPLSAKIILLAGDADEKEQAQNHAELYLDLSLSDEALAGAIGDALNGIFQPPEAPAAEQVPAQVSQLRQKLDAAAASRFVKEEPVTEQPDQPEDVVPEATPQQLESVVPKAGAQQPEGAVPKAGPPQPEDVVPKATAQQPASKVQGKPAAGVKDAGRSSAVVKDHVSDASINFNTDFGKDLGKGEDKDSKDLVKDVGKDSKDLNKDFSKDLSKDLSGVAVKESGNHLSEALSEASSKDSFRDTDKDTGGETGKGTGKVGTGSFDEIMQRASGDGSSSASVPFVAEDWDRSVSTISVPGQSEPSARLHDRDRRSVSFGNFEGAEPLADAMRRVHKKPKKRPLWLYALALALVGVPGIAYLAFTAGEKAAPPESAFTSRTSPRLPKNRKPTTQNAATAIAPSAIPQPVAPSTIAPAPTAALPAAKVAPGTVAKPAAEPAPKQVVIAGVRTIPSMVAQAKLDPGYAKTHPGWQRYLDEKLEYKLFKEAEFFKALQVLGRNGASIPDQTFKRALLEFGGIDSYRVESTSEKGKYLVEQSEKKGGVALTLYRNKGDHQMKAFVLYYN
jgi:DNA-binding NarL/FixJ family response regulator